MKVDAVLQYFEEADLEAAKVILHIATRTLEKRGLERGLDDSAPVVKRNRRTMSAEGRQRIADAQKARWAAKAKPKQRKSNSNFEHSQEAVQALEV